VEKPLTLTAFQREGMRKPHSESISILPAYTLGDASAERKPLEGLYGLAEGSRGLYGPGDGV
jgi:hypothetical protein